MVGNSALVFGLSTVSLGAYFGVAFVLGTRRGGASWNLLCASAILAAARETLRMVQAASTPHVYDHLTRIGWTILTLQTVQGFVMWALAWRVLSGNRDRAKGA